MHCFYFLYPTEMLIKYFSKSGFTWQNLSLTDCLLIFIKLFLLLAPLTIENFSCCHCDQVRSAPSACMNAAHDMRRKSIGRSVDACSCITFVNSWYPAMAQHPECILTAPRAAVQGLCTSFSELCHFQFHMNN